MLLSLTVVVVSRKDIFAFDTSCVNFIDGTVLRVSYSAKQLGENEYATLLKPPSKD
jgi:hypothetical protein